MSEKVKPKCPACNTVMRVANFDSGRIMWYVCPRCNTTQTPNEITEVNRETFCETVQPKPEGFIGPGRMKKVKRRNFAEEKSREMSEKVKPKADEDGNCAACHYFSDEFVACAAPDDVECHCKPEASE